MEIRTQTHTFFNRLNLRAFRSTEDPLSGANPKPATIRPCSLLQGNNGVWPTQVGYLLPEPAS